MVLAAMMGLSGIAGAGAQPLLSTSATTTYHTVEVDGLKLFYREAGPRDMLVVKARTPHGYISAGSGILKQLDIHVCPRFQHELVDPTEMSRRADLPERSEG